jgi:hypothetical protein
MTGEREVLHNKDLLDKKKFDLEMMKNSGFISRQLNINGMDLSYDLDRQFIKHKEYSPTEEVKEKFYNFKTNFLIDNKIISTWNDRTYYINFNPYTNKFKVLNPVSHYNSISVTVEQFKNLLSSYLECGLLGFDTNGTN